MNKKFAVLEDNNVINVIMAESKEIAQELFNRPCFEIQEGSSADIEWKFNPVTQELYLPEPEVTE
jgi:hypothetical protein